MNRQAAKKKTDEFEGTYGDLIEIIKADTKPDEKTSTLNPALTHGHSKEILLKAIEQNDPTTKVKIWVVDPYSPSGRMKRCITAMTVQNVFRECA